MNKRLVGLILIFCSVAVSLSGLAITGNVVGSSITNYLSIISVGFLLTGTIFLFAHTAEIRGYAAEHPLEDLVNSVFSIEGKDVAFVVDSSAAIKNTDEIPLLLSTFEGNVYLPKNVIKELSKGGKRGRQVLAQFIDPKAGKFRTRSVSSSSKETNKQAYGQYLRLARDSLRETEKHREYLTIKRAIEKGNVNDLEGEYQEILRRVKRYLVQDNRAPNEENILNMLKHEYKVSKGDLDVLTTSLNLAFAGRKTRVLARDSHIREAIEDLREKYAPLKANLIYEESRPPVAA